MLKIGSWNGGESSSISYEVKTMHFEGDGFNWKIRYAFLVLFSVGLDCIDCLHLIRNSTASDFWISIFNEHSTCKLIFDQALLLT